MKKGQICHGVVESLAFPNKGKVRITKVIDEPDSDDIGAVVTVKNCIPGQEIEFRVTKKRSDRMQGNLLSVFKRADSEIVPDYCKHFGICGGCTYQSLGYDTQIDIKTKQIRDLFTPVIGEKCFDEVFEGIKRSPYQYAYRNKMEFSFGDELKDGPLTLGMHKRGSFYDVVTVSDCRIIDKDYKLILESTLEYFTKLGVSHFHKVQHSGYLRHMLVRKAVKTGEILVCLVTSSDYDSKFEKKMLADWSSIIEGLDFNGKLVGILHTTNDAVGDAVKDEGTEILFGRNYITEELLGLTFQITPFSFFQTNSLGAEVLYETAREFIGDGVNKDTCLFDLYSGTGTIAQVMSPAVSKVIGVEIVEEAVEAAKENAKINGLDNCEFIAGDVLKVLENVEDKPDYIILDPPREGIMPKALDKIIDYGVDSLIYISCKPTSLARDLEVLLKTYKIKRMACVDMFPGTGHVETVCLLCNQAQTSTKWAYVTLTMEEYRDIKAKSEAQKKANNND
ncbi:MAG: 23S rRNA (uracil(1939)-C(5))-methyltransferase RlmD [Lachnospiraceae bacterium]|nr:23S rRNA (uracil(1939)-C(5))-methyltransferase RlmD [Lachnospiraceae bacterium]